MNTWRGTQFRLTGISAWRGGWWPLWLAFLFGPGPGCSKAPAPSRPDAAVLSADLPVPGLSVPEEVPSPPRGLRLSDQPPVGTYLLPAGAQEGLADDDTTRYEIEAGLGEIMEFYRARGYRVVRNPRGATIYPKQGEGLLQVLPQSGRKVRLLFLTPRANDQTATPPQESNR